MKQKIQERKHNRQAACLRQKGKRPDRRSEKEDSGDGRDRKKRPVTMTSVSRTTPALSASAAVSGRRQAAAHFKSTSTMTDTHTLKVVDEVSREESESVRKQTHP